MRSFGLIFLVAAGASFGPGCGRVQTELLDDPGGDASADGSVGDTEVEMRLVLQITTEVVGNRLVVGQLDQGSGPLDVVGYDEGGTGIYVFSDFVGAADSSSVTMKGWAGTVGASGIPALGLILFDIDRDSRAEPVWVEGKPGSVPPAVYKLDKELAANNVTLLPHDPPDNALGGPIHAVSVNWNTDDNLDLVFFDFGRLVTSNVDGLCLGTQVAGATSPGWGCTLQPGTDVWSVVYDGPNNPELIRFVDQPAGHIIYQFIYDPVGNPPTTPPGHRIVSDGFVGTGVKIVRAVAAEMLPLVAGDEVIVLLPDGAVEVWRLGAGEASGPTFGQAMPGSTDLIVADLNGDGLKDVVVAQPNGTLAAMVNDGTGSSVDLQTFSLGSRPINALVSVGDYDGNGSIDVVASQDQQLYHVEFAAAE